MKNFFKKLSFVLAIAMVLTSIAPATASAAEVVPAKKVNIKVDGEKTTSIEMDVEETETVKIGLPVKKAYKGQKSTYKTWAVTEGTAVEVVRVGNRTYELTAVEAGEATITINAAKTKKLAKAGEGKSATLTVVVNAPAVELAAKQTGAAEITVTGADLTDVAADYVVKRGSVTTSIKSVELNEDKTEAVLVASVTNLPAGDYTLKFKDSDAVEFAVEKAVVANIEILSDVAVLKAGSTTQAAVYYKITNQFEEDITKVATMTGSTKITVSGVGAASDYAGTVTFTSTTPFTPNLSVVALTIVCNDNGVNVAKTLTVSNESLLSSVEYVGVYSDVTGVWAPAELKENTTATDLENHYVALFSGKDQYGYDYNLGDKLNVVISGIPGVVATGSAIDEFTLVDGSKYIAFKLSGNYNLMAGSSNVLAIVTNNGNSAQATIEVAPVTKIDSIEIFTAEVYGGQSNELQYEVLNTDGEAVTSYATLKTFELANAGYLPTGATFKRNTDGTAKLVYTAASNDTQYDSVAVLTFRSETNKFSSARLTVKPNCVPTAIAGVKATTILGAVSGQTLDIYAGDLVILDQYGNTVSDVSGVAVTATVSADTTGAFAGATGAAVVATAATTKVISIPTVAGKIGTLEVTFTLTGNADSASTVTVLATDIEKVSNFAIADTALLHHNTSGNAITVTGKVGTTLVKLPTDCYTVVDNTDDGTTVTTPEIYTSVEGKITKSLTFNVAIANKAGTLVSKTVQYSNTDDTVTTVYLNPFATLTSTNVDMDDLLGCLVIKDQYSEYDIVDANARALVSGIVTPTAAVTGNNTKNVAITGLSIYDVSLHVVFTFSNGVVYETDIPVVIE